ncbi:spore coat associated protein CotJA [Clostridium oryzae]|uniref:Spore coat associated protein CotJA n=1 Tax=Clostridium oryzae TaxID=1450648 RepID=A0A1V4IDU9_9CLOT|nr:spore coat associated protein CotJA [Clostridium oryzae]OPJ58060.1 spore coat associated protein CotJA [Clostridium oryzae]
MMNYMRPDADMLDMYCPRMDKCIPQELTIRDVRLATAYVPFQKLCNTFSPIEALKLGTIFPELYSPYNKKAKNYKPEGKR